MSRFNIFFFLYLSIKQNPAGFWCLLMNKNELWNLRDSLTFWQMTELRWDGNDAHKSPYEGDFQWNHQNGNKSLNTIVDFARIILWGYIFRFSVCILVFERQTKIWKEKEKTECHEYSSLDLFENRRSVWLKFGYETIKNENNWSVRCVTASLISRD